MTSPRTDQHSGNQLRYPELAEHQISYEASLPTPPSHHLVEDDMTTDLHQLSKVQGNILLCLYLVPKVI